MPALQLDSCLAAEPSPLTAGRATPVLRRQLLKDRAVALQTNGSAAVGLGSFPLLRERRLGHDLIKPLAASCGSEWPLEKSGGVVDPVRGHGAGDAIDQLLQGSVHLELARRFVDREPLQRRACSAAACLRREGDSGTPCGVGSLPFALPPPSASAEHPDADLELRLYAALLQPESSLTPSGASSDPSRRLPRQGKPISPRHLLGVQSQDLASHGAAESESTPSAPSKPRRSAFRQPDLEQQFCRSGGARVRRASVAADGRGDNENRIRRKGTGFVRLNRHREALLFQLEDMLESCGEDRAQGYEDTQNSMPAAGCFTDSWIGAEMLDLSRSGWWDPQKAFARSDFHDQKQTLVSETLAHREQLGPKSSSAPLQSRRILESSACR